MKMIGHFSLMLHSHIPYCRKSGVWPAGEEWLFEAMNETYIPIISMLRKFQIQNRKPRIMIGIVPILAEQLSDKYMNDRFCEYMDDKIQRAENDIVRFRNDPLKLKVANFWAEKFINNFNAYKNDFYRDILGTLKWLQNEKVIEVLTSAATHGFLPLMKSDSSIHAQVEIGISTYEKHFNIKPKGFWLPECAYRGKEGERPAIDDFLSEKGIQYTFIENVGIENAVFIENRNSETTPSTYKGYKLESGVCVFGRNKTTGKQVWSSEIGYPGDPNYREFHIKDPQSGLHYFRVTGNPEKEIYKPQSASESVKNQARHFFQLVKNKLLQNVDKNDLNLPIIVSPYDCELFGHWWLEGVEWMNNILDIMLNQTDVQLISLSDYIKENHENFSTIRMKPSSWGENSDFTVWNNPEHSWLWPYIDSCSVDFEKIINTFKFQKRNLDERGMRIMKQMAREKLLLEGSDWPFLLHTKQAKEYANQRFHNHHQRFNKLLWAAKNLDDKQRISDEELTDLEVLDNPWPELDLKLL